MARGGSYTYDPKTGQWTQGSSPTDEKKTTTQDKASKSSSDKLTASSTNKKTSKGKAEKKYNKIEYNIFTIMGGLYS